MLKKNKDLLEISISQLQQVDISEILHFGGYIIYLYFANKAIDSYILYRKSKPKSIKKVKLPEEIKVKCDNVDLEEVSKKQFGEYLVNFSNVVVNNFSKDDLTNFYNNINTVNTKIKNFKLKNFIFNDNTAATYQARQNLIKLNKTYVEKNIYHELFHMSSSKIINKYKIYCGFRQNNIGRAINEGYTELLTYRYFSLDNASSCIYEYLKITVENLEKIVGKEKMESLYLNANLYGLINELKKYSNEEEIMRFIANTDFINDHLNEKRIKYLEKKLILKSLKEVNKFLTITFYNKQKNYVDNNIITKEQALNNLVYYWDGLPSSIKIDNYLFDICLDEKLSSWLEEYNKDINKDPIKNKTKKLSK